MPPKQTILPAPSEEPSGICECGCGEPTGRVSTYTRPESRRWTGYPVPFIRGHTPRTPRSDRGVLREPRYVPTPDEVPSGVCECGCGKSTPISTRTHRPTRYFRGHPTPFLQGHTPGRFKKGSESHRWRGGRILRKGYVMLHMPEHPKADSKGYVSEHVVVWEKANGRLPHPNEDIHHINGIKTDNRPENLVALTKSAHAREHAERLVRNADIARTADPELATRSGAKGAATRWHKGQ